MKIVLAALVAVIAPSCAFAQSLDLQPGYTQEQILSVPYSISGFDFDSSDNLVFTGGDPGSPPQQDALLEATASNSYATVTPLTEFSPTYSSFVTVQGNTAYYGDSVSGNIYTVSTTPITSPTTPNTLANVTGNYDLEFSGTSAFVSAYFSGTSNGVFTLNTSTGAYAQIMDTQGDYSGPIALTSSGGLIYGATGAAGIYGIYTFTPAQVQGAISSGTELTLSEGALLVSNSGNSSLAMGPDDELYQAFSPYAGAAASITGYNLDTGISTLIGTVDPTYDYAISDLQYNDGAITIAETDENTFTDFITINTAAVPEPGTVTLGLGGLLLAAAAFRRRGRKP